MFFTSDHPLILVALERKKGYLMAMNYVGKVKNGVVVLPPGLDLKDGAEVELTPVMSERATEDFTDALLRIARRTKNLPADLARNHDFYLHGLPKR